MASSLARIPAEHQHRDQNFMPLLDTTMATDCVAIGLGCLPGRLATAVQELLPGSDAMLQRVAGQAAGQLAADPWHVLLPADVAEPAACQASVAASSPASACQSWNVVAAGSRGDEAAGCLRQGWEAGAQRRCNEACEHHLEAGSAVLLRTPAGDGRVASERQALGMPQLMVEGVAGCSCRQAPVAAVLATHLAEVLQLGSESAGRSATGGCAAAACATHMLHASAQDCGVEWPRFDELFEAAYLDVVGAAGDGAAPTRPRPSAACR